MVFVIELNNFSSQASFNNLFWVPFKMKVTAAIFELQ